MAGIRRYDIADYVGVHSDVGMVSVRDWHVLAHRAIVPVLILHQV